MALQTIKLTYASCDRFLPFDRFVEASDICYAINSDGTWLAVAMGSDIDVYDLRRGSKAFSLDILVAATPL